MAPAPRVVRLFGPDGEQQGVVIGIPTGDLAPEQMDPNVVAEALSDVIMFMPTGHRYHNAMMPMPIVSHEHEYGSVVVYDGYDGPKQACPELLEWCEKKRTEVEKAVLDARSALSAAEDEKNRILSSMLSSRSNHLAATRGELV
jgi:hypothetical protein